MHFWQILKRDLLFYRRSHLGMVLLAAVCCAILTGALLVGDSVQYSLRRLGEMRLGAKTRLAMSSGDKFFRQELASKLSKASNTTVVPVLSVKGILETADGSIRVSDLNVYGVDLRFWRLIPPPGQAINSPIESGVAVSESVQARLGSLDGEYLLRMQLPTALSRDLIFSTEAGDSQAWPIEISGVVSDDGMGRFSLQTLQEPPLNVFVPIEWLAEKMGHDGKANLLLIGEELTPVGSPEDFSQYFKQSATLADVGLELRRIESENVFELRSPRIFLDARMETIADAGVGGAKVLTYFVNEIRAGEKATPYSMVAGLDEAAGLVLEDDEIAINEWLANDLNADEGDTIELTYFQVTPTRKLIEQTHTLKVGAVVPMMGPYADASLMPAFPGFSEAEGCRDWDTGIPIDLDRIRQADEDYWERFRGTPKAFVALKTAQSIWGNHFGSLTAIRWPASGNTEQDLAAAIKEQMKPAEIGFVFQDVHRRNLQSAAGSTDFSGLFAGLSMFLIFSAAILLGLVFVFYVESRSRQIGLLQAVGWGPMKVFALFISEGAVVALIGCLVGAAVSVVYTAGLIKVLNATFWGGALANLQLAFYAEFNTLLMGVCVSFLICILAMQVALYHRTLKPIVRLLGGAVETFQAVRRSRFQVSLWLGGICVVAGLLLPIQAGLKLSQAALFFMSGSLLLIGFFALSAFGLKWLRFQSGSFASSPVMLAIKHIPRRAGRSLTVLITLACGVFMVVSVGANHKELGDAGQKRSSGTGGFALLGQSTVGMTEVPSLQATAGGIGGIDTTQVAAFRQNRGDDASCLNLNRAAEPTLLGIDPQILAKKEAFKFQKALIYEENTSPWMLLEMELAEDEIAAVADYSTVVWGLRKGLGDTISYRAENGRMFHIKIVGILKESVLQGRLIIAEDAFVRRFPSVDGKSVFLVDADWEQYPLQSQELMRKYRDFGLELMPAAGKLAQLHEVENTYMAIFLMLGGLGLVLGSAGLGLVLVLNVLDRKGELAMMQAVGFRKSALTRMLFAEHGLLLAAGLLCGLIPAMLAVVPVMRTQGMDFPMGKILLVMTLMLISGAVWIRIAITRSVSTQYLETLRNE